MRIYYRYPHLGLGRIDLWVSQPVDGLTQRNVTTVQCSHTPRDRVETGGNTLLRYRLRPFQTLKVVWEFEPVAARPQGGALSETERAYYLRASIQIGREPELVAHAREIAGAETDPVEIARAFLAELVSDYDYMYPVFRRGALAMEHKRRGDCGQFSVLFVAWCRALGIPARTVLGTLVQGTAMLPHAWAEFWSDTFGWMPVDGSAAHAYGNSSDYFGKLPADRFAFSYDTDVPLPQYGRRVLFASGGTIVSPCSFGGRPLRWGTRTLDGAVPFFQPAYPRSYPDFGLALYFPTSQMGIWSAEEDRRVAQWQAFPWAGPLALLAICAFVLHGLTSFLLFSILGYLFLFASLAWAASRLRPWVHVPRLRMW